ADEEATASNAHQTATNPPDASLQATNATAEPKPYTDEELTKKLTDAMNERTEDTTGDAGAKSAVEVNKDSVTFVTSQTYASIEEMLKESYAIWSRGGMYFENACFETDTNGLLRVTFTPQAGMERDMKNASAEWKLTGAKSELKLVFPGKVVSSGFPAMDTNATWVLVDGKQSETVEAMAKLYAAPTVITAEAGGLKLDQPLESKKLIRARRHPGADNDDLPITDAGPGFAAEAQSVTTTMLHVFPGGEDYFKNGGSSGTQTGAVVNAKLFAPKGRTLQSVSDVRVLKAVDDKGRSVVAEEPADEENDSSETFSRDSQDTSSLQVQLHLQLPQPDAQSIDTISAEAVAMTVGTWKEMTLTNLQENATNETDLAAVLPGAKLVIIKNSSKKNQIIIQARIKGPRAVSRLEVHAKKPGNEQFNSSTSERSSSAKGTESTRNITIQGYDFGDGGAASPEAVILTIRYPEDQKRERVKFELKSLDLL
ncbi:MAG TPA: hypothetical protein VK815_05745, partial [Candidatus Acidoferrales bacterium]|nr:hypothetical protein [Candidatus Acidoferrales bacterium]